MLPPTVATVPYTNFTAVGTYTFPTRTYISQSPTDNLHIQNNLQNLHISEEPTYFPPTNTPLTRRRRWLGSSWQGDRGGSVCPSERLEALHRCAVFAFVERSAWALLSWYAVLSRERRFFRAFCFSSIKYTTSRFSSFFGLFLAVLVLARRCTFAPPGNAHKKSGAAFAPSLRVYAVI